MIQWIGRPAGDATWEMVNEFRQEHPEFQLEDELFRKEGGSVVDVFVGRTYSRRKRPKDAGSVAGSAAAAPAE